MVRPLCSSDFDWFADFEATKEGNERRLEAMRQHAQLLTTGYNRARCPKTAAEQAAITKAVFFGFVCKDEELGEAYRRLYEETPSYNTA